MQVPNHSPKECLRCASRLPQVCKTEVKMELKGSYICGSLWKVWRTKLSTAFRGQRYAVSPLSIQRIVMLDTAFLWWSPAS